MARRYAVNANVIVNWLRDPRYAPDPAAVPAPAVGPWPAAGSMDVGLG